MGGGDGVSDVYKYNVEYANVEQLNYDSLNVGRKHHGCATYEESGETKVKIHQPNFNLGGITLLDLTNKHTEKKIM